MEQITSTTGRGTVSYRSGLLTLMPHDQSLHLLAVGAMLKGLLLEPSQIVEKKTEPDSWSGILRLTGVEIGLATVFSTLIRAQLASSDPESLAGPVLESHFDPETISSIRRSIGIVASLQKFFASIRGDVRNVHRRFIGHLLSHMLRNGFEPVPDPLLTKRAMHLYLEQSSDEAHWTSLAKDFNKHKFHSLAQLITCTANLVSMTQDIAAPRGDIFQEIQLHEAEALGKTLRIYLEVNWARQGNALTELIAKLLELLHHEDNLLSA